MGMHWQRSVPSRQPGAAGDGGVEPLKHVIEEYRHRLRRVTCTCGWQGTSNEGDPKGWKAHLAQVRREQREEGLKAP